MAGTAVFLDTTIQISRFVGAPQIKRRIQHEIRSRDLAVTSLVVRQEWKRRLLTDAKYLLDVLRRNGKNCSATLHHINRKLSSPRNRRKLSICLDLVATNLDGEELENLLVVLIEDGLSLFEHNIHIVKSSNCGCGKRSVTTRNGDYEIGQTRCRTAPDGCGISEFFESRREKIQQIASYLGGVSHKSKSEEIRSAEELIEKWLKGSLDPFDHSPCLSFGDLTIALESSGIPVFYTSNLRESEHLCQALKQDLLACDTDPNGDDKLYTHGAS